MIDAPTAEATAAPQTPAAAQTPTPAPDSTPTPAATPQSSVLGMEWKEKSEAKTAEPTKTGDAPAPEASAADAKPEEKPADATPAEEDVEYVKASDYDKAQQQLQKYLEKYGELPADDAPATEEKPAENPQAQQRKPVEINPDLVMLPEDVADEDLELLGWDSTTEEGRAQRVNAAKFGSKIASRAAEYAEAAATAKFKASMAEDIALQVAVHYAHQGVASALLTKHPELGSKENFPKVVKAIQQATGELGMNAPMDGVAAKAKQLLDEGQHTVERFKSQGGKVISPGSAGPGTTPRGASQAPAGPSKRTTTPFGPGSLLGGQK